MSKPFAETFFSGYHDDRDRRDERLPASDPLALFHQLPAGEPREDEVAAMKAAVAELRAARELSRRSEQLTGERPAAPVKRRPWRIAAAAAFLASTLFFFGGPARQESGNGATETARGAAAQTAAAATLAGNAASHLPLIEDLDPRQAELIQFEDEGVSLVVVLAAGSV